MHCKVEASVLNKDKRTQNATMEFLESNTKYTVYPYIKEPVLQILPLLLMMKDFVEGSTTTMRVFLETSKYVGMIFDKDK